MSIGENIKNCRKGQGLTQKQLSELSGVHEVQIARYENGKSKPSIEVLKKICKALNQPYILWLDKETAKIEIDSFFDEHNKKVNEINKNNGVYEIIKRIHFLGYTLAENISETKKDECDFYFLFNNGNIPITTNELQELQKEMDSYLNYLIQKFINSKPLQNEDEDYSELISQSKNKE